MMARHHLAYRARTHRGTNLNRWQVAFSIGHPAPLGGIKREIEVADQYLPIANLWDRRLGIFEVTLRHHALWAGCEQPLSIDIHLHSPRGRAAFRLLALVSSQYSITRPSFNDLNITARNCTGCPFSSHPWFARLDPVIPANELGYSDLFAFVSFLYFPDVG